MKDRRVRILSSFLAAALCVTTLLLPASAAEDGVTVWNDTIGGNTARLVTVAMTPGRTGEVALANDSVVESASAKTILDTKDAQADTHVVAAINGGFFNSYTKGEPVFPASCPMILNAVVKDGRLIHSGNTTAIGFTAGGKALVDWVTLSYQVQLGNGFTVGGDWGMNVYLTDPYAIMLFDEHLTLPIDVPSSSTMFYIEGGAITKAMPGSSITVPAGTHVLVYNSAVAEMERGHDRLPEVGMTADIVLTAAGTDRDTEWTGVRDALVGGPLLVKDGVNVVDDTRNQGFYSDPKQRPDTVLGRSFVGVLGNGSLVLGTVSASFRQIADWMVANGVQEGVSMDGGASSMLYADGSFVTPAGRALASVLTIVDKSGGAQTTQPSVDPGAPSAWAAAEIQTAISAGLVPESIQKSYPAPITRQDFCRLIWELIKKQPDYLQLLWGKDQVVFPDATADEVNWCAQLGLVSGTGDGRFEPFRQLKRSEAAKILALTTQLLGVADTGARSASFTDRASFGWAEPFIDYCGVNGIMNGGDGVFDPDGTFSREQAIATILRIYQRYGS